MTRRGRISRLLHLQQRSGTGPWRHPVRWMIIGLAVTITIGLLLLLLPAATQGPHGAGFRVALFTAVSASCATGMTIVDTGTTWSGFGQAVILTLVEVGGLGMMITATLLGAIAASRLGLRSRLTGLSSSGKVDLAMTRRVVLGSVFVALIVQTLIFLALTLRLCWGYDYPPGRAAHFGLFHAISAFNNSGFTLWPDSLTAFSHDLAMLLPLLFGIVLGGLGYPVLVETVRVRPIRRWSVHTRLTLVITGLLILAGPIAVLISEWRNPGTLAELSPSSQMLSGVFDGIAPRSSAFHTIDYGQADASTLLIMDLLMVVGAGSGGTAGGIKVTTVAVVVLAVIAEVRGHPDIDVFDRRLTSGALRQALAVCGLAMAVIGVFVLALLEMTEDRLGEVLFDVSSAFGSVGLTTGITAELPPVGQYLIVLIMVIGRVGPIALATSLALRPTRRTFRNPESRPILG
jgi:trk system potassium uptake protein